MPSGIDSNDPVYASLVQKLRDEQHDPHSAEVREPTHAWGVLPDLIGVDAEGGTRFLRASLVESVSPHQEGSIIKTQSGDFHKVDALPEAVVRALGDAAKVRR